MAFVILACGAAVLLWAAGWLAGARRGKRARTDLRHALVNAERRADALAARLDASDDADALRDSVRAVLGPLEARAEESQKLEALVRAVLTERAEESRALEDTVRAVLGPLAARERIGLELSTLDAKDAARRNLPELLDRIANRSGLGTMLLCDEAGLPLASTTTGTLANDALAAMSALLLNLVDRIEATGSPAPFSAVFRDEANQVILHRVFAVGRERFVLSAATRGRAMTPDDLDPALNRIVHALTPQSS